MAFSLLPRLLGGDRAGCAQALVFNSVTHTTFLMTRRVRPDLSRIYSKAWDVTSTGA